jgi:hypothetical protein
MHTARYRQVDDNGWSAVSYAAQGKHHETVAALGRAGAAPNKDEILCEALTPA